VVVVVVAVASVAVTTAVVIVAVAAELGSAELVSAAAVETPADATESSPQQGRAANTNVSGSARPARGTGEVAAPAPARPVVEVPAELAAIATEIGTAWAQTYVRALQAQERDIVGAWPGTIREARRQVLARIKAKLEPEALDQLARITNLAARRGWETVSEPDLES
jgi:hypothetical protein